MSALACVRCVIPRFAQAVRRSTALTTIVLPKTHPRIIFKRHLTTTIPKTKRETILVYFRDREGDTIAAKAVVGSSLLTVAIDNGVELEATFKAAFFSIPQEIYKLITSLFNSVTSVTVHFVCDSGSKLSTKAKVGDNLLDVVVDNDVDLDGFGACEGTLACSTCHLIFKQEDFDKIPEEATEEELDMLDLAYGLEDTSRLGCQIIVTKDMDGLVVRVPAGVADAREPS